MVLGWLRGRGFRPLFDCVDAGVKSFAATRRAPGPPSGGPHFCRFFAFALSYIRPCKQMAKASIIYLREPSVWPRREVRQNKMSNQIQVGDVVQLKSGGPKMTVSKIREWNGRTEAN